MEGRKDKKVRKRNKNAKMHRNEGRKEGEIKD